MAHNNEINAINSKKKQIIMSNKKQSSLEFFAKMLVEQGLLYTNDFENLITYQKAKAMHKEEIAKSYFEGENRKWNSVNGYEYYNETFGGNNEQQNQK